MQQREVIGCISSLGNTVEDERCAADKQHTQKDCSFEECPSWSYSEWSPVSLEAHHLSSLLYQKLTDHYIYALLDFLEDLVMMV